MIKIGVFDSGEGGLSVLKEITRLLPEAEYIYYSDNAHCPYGEKSPEYIQDRARAITERLLKEGADVIVVACNTATAAAISVSLSLAVRIIRFFSLSFRKLPGRISDSLTRLLLSRVSWCMSWKGTGCSVPGRRLLHWPEMFLLSRLRLT